MSRTRRDGDRAARPAPASVAPVPRLPCLVRPAPTPARGRWGTVTTGVRLAPPSVEALHPPVDGSSRPSGDGAGSPRRRTVRAGRPIGSPVAGKSPGPGDRAPERARAVPAIRRTVTIPGGVPGGKKRPAIKPFLMGRSDAPGIDDRARGRGHAGAPRINGGARVTVDDGTRAGPSPCRPSDTTERSGAVPHLPIGAVRATVRSALRRLDGGTLETLNSPAGGRRPRL